jgi:outer membrane protein insertion porin family
VNMLRWSPVALAALSVVANVGHADLASASSLKIAIAQPVDNLVVPTEAAPSATPNQPAIPANSNPDQSAPARPQEPGVIVVPIAPTGPVIPAAELGKIAQANAEQETPNVIKISPETGNPTAPSSPSIKTPPPPAVAEPKVPPSEITLPPSQNKTVPGAPAPAPGSEPRVLVAEVAVKGTSGELQNEIYRVVRTKPGQTTTRTQLQEDINAIFATGFFSNVKATPEDTPLGVRVTFEVEANPIFKAIRINGNTVFPAAEVEALFQPQLGQNINLRQVQRSVQELVKKYQDKGYVLAQVVDLPKVSPDGTVTVEVAEGSIETISVQFINKQGETSENGKAIKGRTRDFIIKREMELKPGQVFNKNTAESDLARIFGLGIFDDVKLGLDPGQDARKVNVVVNVAEKKAGSIAAGAGISSASGLFGTASYQQQNLGGNNQKLGAELQLGQRELLFDVNFTNPWIAGDPYRTSYTINGFRRRSISLIYDGGDEVRVLNNGTDRDRPRVVRSGGGISFTRPLSKDVFKRSPLTASLGLQYQQVRIQDSDGDLIQDNAPQVNDANQVVGIGSDLSFSGKGKDDLFTLQFGLSGDYRNDPLRPTSGSLFRIGTEQSVPLGQGSIFFNRLRGSYSFYVPTRLTKFTPECRTINPKRIDLQQKVRGVCPQAFAFNVQGGTVLGDLPPYEAFSLGGSNSVRGYDEGDVGSGKSFLQATAEYRFPLFSIVSAAAFIDAATDFGSGSNVKGDPAGLRGKPGNGIGYGLGVRIQSPLGPIRVDYGFNDRGDGRLHFGIGERF